MTDPCPRVQDAFAFSIGELGLRESISVSFHLLRCKECRRETKRLRNTSVSVARAYGQGMPVLNAKPLAIKAGWAVVAAGASIGLYAAGQQAVQAAMATLDRPHIRQATFSEDDRSERDKRIRNATQ